MANPENTVKREPVHLTICPYCHRRFETPAELTLHVVTRHTQIGIKRGPAQAGNSK
jgi:uncharacterized protein YlaI